MWRFQEESIEDARVFGTTSDLIALSMPIYTSKEIMRCGATENTGPRERASDKTAAKMEYRENEYYTEMFDEEPQWRVGIIERESPLITEVSARRMGTAQEINEIDTNQ